MKLPKWMQAQSLEQVNKEIAKKYPHVFLVKGRGYFYIASNDEETALKIAGLYTTSIPVAHLKQQTLATWVSDVVKLMNDEWAQ